MADIQPFNHSTRLFKSIKFKLFSSTTRAWSEEPKKKNATQSNEIYFGVIIHLSHTKRTFRSRIANPTKKKFQSNFCFVVIGRFILKFLALHCQLSKVHCVQLTMKMTNGTVDWHACRRRQKKSTPARNSHPRHPMVLIFNCFINENRFILVGYAKDAANCS